MIGWIALGGIVGTLARYKMGAWLTQRMGNAFPWGTWMINISGSMLLGLLYGWYTRDALSSVMWSLLGIGFCGAYTTFSTFGYETIQLMEQHKYARTAAYVLSSVIVGVGAATAGFLFTR